MLLTPEQANERLGSPANLANRFGRSSLSPNSPQNQKPHNSTVNFIPIHRPGRKADVPNMDAIKRNEIALRSRLGENQKTLATEFSTTQARVSQIERGKDKSLDEKALGSALSEIRDIAVDKLMVSLGLIDGEKLAKETAQGLSRVAANLSKVIEKTLPKEESAGTQVNVVVYCPDQRKEDSFKVVDVTGK